MRLSPVHVRFSCQDTFRASPPEACEALLPDAMPGDPAQFMRADSFTSFRRGFRPTGGI